MSKDSTFKRLHTCDHILSGILEKNCGRISIYGLKISDDKVRFPFKVEKMPSYMTKEYIEDKVNAITARNIPVEFVKIDREEAKRRKIDISLVPESANEITLTIIGDVNTQACIGPHVENTREIAEYGTFSIIKFEKKGKNTFQITAELMPKNAMEKNNKTKVKKPRLLKGFQDFFGPDMRLRKFVIGTFEDVFERYGYEPLETPAVEYADLMLGQSGEEAEKQFYMFKDPGDRDVMLKFEVMISMCRAVAQNLGDIKLPYKRYQIQRTWRAENTQRGRYREFTQCDADTVGSSSMICDAEHMQMGLDVVNRLGFKEYKVRISNRKFLEGLADSIGVDKNKFYGFCVSLDKLQKIGAKEVIDEMVEVRGISRDVAEETLDITNIERYKNKSYRETIEEMRKAVGDSKIGNEGLNEILQIADYLEAVDIDESKYEFDPSLARGLASYTGPVWEFEIIDGNVGSIAGCGRYDEAISRYIGRDIPATGGSFGIERICDIMRDRKMKDFSKPEAEVLVTIFDKNLWKDSLRIADYLRKQNISAMLYPDVTSLKSQFGYANKTGIPWVVVVGPDELKENKVQLKDMKKGSQSLIALEDVKDQIKTDE
ncbi:histidine--tRNA ligase [Candidatus Dojkabacteria bacterium]|nr:histidine--tRNA ligase [Candidatus Dojkabacteria bacterium]